MDSCARELITLSPGAIVDSRYRIERCLGIGSMSVVYAARGVADGAPCAIKIFGGDDSLSTPTFHTRFRIGARIAQLVIHPHVVRVLDFIDQPEILAVVMELIDGGDLASRVRHKGPYSVPEMLRVFRQIAEGVQAIHEAGIVHRDIKPANILLDRSGDAKISDFGIALNGETPRLTAPGGVVGTLQYLSPEQLQGEQATVQSDIYALGAVAYEMLTGSVPGSDDSVFKLVDLRVSSDARPVAELNPLCPKPLGDIIARALQRDPKDRYRSVKDLLDELDRLRIEGPAKLNSFQDSRKSGILDQLFAKRSFARLKGIGAQAMIAVILSALLLLLLRPYSRPSSVELPSDMRTAAAPQVPVDSAVSQTRLSSAVPLPATVVGTDSLRLDPANLAARQTLLYRIADFVRWPAQTFKDKAVPLRLCIWGKDPFGVNFDRALSKARTHQGRAFWLQRFEASAGPELLASCQILYVPDMSASQAEILLAPFRKLPVLTVTESSGQGIVDFVKSQDRVTFLVDQAGARRAGLELSPILLDVAAQVERTP
ncbi:MAG: DUF4154 domain-containing protein [Deltaproteobacteria bacterium]|nr:DUF4154 domain-containing protein [Deltaproteobacteria bacterium]